MDSRSTENEKNLPISGGTPENGAAVPRHSKWFGRGIYGSKDVPIRALDTFILCLVAAILLCTLIGALGGGFQVSFDTGISDVTVAAQKVRYGEYAAEPQAPVRPGYTLAGWSTDKQEKTLWNFTYTAVQNDTMLYAVWKPAKYTVHWDLAGGTVDGSAAAADQTVTFGEAYGTLPTPQKEGFTFAGWQSGDATITPETTVSTIGDQILTAIWQ